MIRITLRIQFHRSVEMLQRFCVFPRLPLHAPSRRLDIAQ